MQLPPVAERGTPARFRLSHWMDAILAFRTTPAGPKCKRIADSRTAYGAGGGLGLEGGTVLGAFEASTGGQGRVWTEGNPTVTTTPGVCTPSEGARGECQGARRSGTCAGDHLSPTLSPTSGGEGEDTGGTVSHNQRMLPSTLGPGLIKGPERGKLRA